MLTKVCVIYNPDSGRASAWALQKIETVFKNAVGDYDLIMVKKNYDFGAVSFVQYDLVIIAGGDGTVSRIAGVLIRQNYQGKIGVLPLGSANFLAANLKIPVKLTEALKIIFESKECLLDVLTVNKKYYCLVALGMGYDGLVMRLTSPRMKRLFGFLAYFWGMLQGVFNLRERSFSLQIDGLRIDRHAKSIFVMNVSEFFHVKLGPKAASNDGLMQVAVVRPVGLVDIGRMFLGIISRRYFVTKRLEFFSARRLEVKYNKIMPLQIDGEIIDLSGESIEITVLPQKLRMICR